MPYDKAARFSNEPGGLSFGPFFVLSIDSGYSELLCGLLFLSVEEREEERNHGCRDPEDRRLREVVYLLAVLRHRNVCVYEPSARHVLQSRSDVAGHAYHSQRGTRRLPRHDVYGHQPAEETDQPIMRRRRI